MNWNATKKEYALALQIALRANRVCPDLCAVRDTEMDIIATHKNGCPLRLAALLAAPDFDFVHDILGIRRFLDRSTGRRLNKVFDPRYSVPQSEAA